MSIQSRIVNVIETKQDDEVSYFTLEGIMIGGFKGGVRVEPVQEEFKKDKPEGAVITAPTPHDMQRQKARKIEAMQTPEGRLKHLKEDVV